MKSCLPFHWAPVTVPRGGDPDPRSLVLCCHVAAFLSSPCRAPFLGRRSRGELRGLCHEPQCLPGLRHGDGKARLLFQASPGCRSADSALRERGQHFRCIFHHRRLSVVPPVIILPRSPEQSARQGPAWASLGWGLVSEASLAGTQKSP